MAATKKSVKSGKSPKPSKKAGSPKVAATKVTTSKLHTTSATIF